MKTLLLTCLTTMSLMASGVNFKKIEPAVTKQINTISDTENVTGYILQSNVSDKLVLEYLYLMTPNGKARSADERDNPIFASSMQKSLCKPTAPTRKYLSNGQLEIKFIYVDLKNNETTVITVDSCNK